MYPSTLMRAVDIGLALSENDLHLIRAVRTLAAHGELPSLGHAAGRTHDIIIGTVFIKLRSLGGMIIVIAVEDDDGVTDGMGAVG